MKCILTSVLFLISGCVLLAQKGTHQKVVFEGPELQLKKAENSSNVNSNSLNLFFSDTLQFIKIKHDSLGSNKQNIDRKEISEKPTTTQPK